VRAAHASEAIRLLRQTHFDLVVLVLPALGAERVLTAVRAEDSACLRSSVLVVGGHEELEPDDLALGRHANRLLPGACGPIEFQQEVATLLAVPPRAAIDEAARLQLTLPTGEQIELRLENLSSSGMLMRASEPLAVGTVFGFALVLADRADPIRGRARVVRVAPRNRAGEPGVGAQFLALGGEGPHRIETAVERALAARANSEVPAVTRPVRTAPVAGPRGSATAEAAGPPDAAEIARCREELADVSAVLDEILEPGLSRRLAVADWYITGAELGLESIRAFSAILAAVYENRRVSAEAERRLADLVEVRSQLAEFGRPQQDVATRVRIMLSLRPALQRLLRELAETGAAAGTSLAASLQPGVVSQAIVEIKRLVGARRSLETLLVLLAERGRTRLLPWGGGARPSPEQIQRDFAPLAGSFGMTVTAAAIRQRGSLRALRRQVELELHGLRRRLATIHQRAYSLKFRALATDDVEADLQDPKLHRVLVDTMAAGAEYLARAYAAYRHALEVIGEQPALIDRVERLSGRLLEADRAGDAVAVPARGLSARGA
ncbi:MAG: PilZ domain-containing protein, partial [Thermoanaerobaculia bacterium]|nr:PilZ domain-containing protein [Thermoanaerobaculia bacterium]